MASSPSVVSFLRKGLLPDSVPPFVSSKSISKSTLATGSSYAVTAEVKGNHSHFNASKRGFQRRVFGISHPAFVRDAALFFVKNWPAIDKQMKATSCSSSVPDFAGTQSRALALTPHSKLPTLRLRRLARYKFCVVTDVSRCFPSIYTHSIPWALNGKENAKKDFKPNSASVWGNRLDYIMRQSQDSQTMGVPVGPDHSRVVAEIILQAIDADFIARVGSATYLRHVDDYWIGGNSYEECEQALHSLRMALNDYSLDINEQKTRIVQTSSVVAEVWPYDLEAQLESALKEEKVARYESRIVSLLGNIVEQSASSSDDGIIKFFIRKLDNWRKWDSHWSLLEPFLAHVAVQFPHCLPYVAQIIVWRLKTGREIDAELWNEITQVLLGGSSAAGRDSETIWALWLSKELDVTLPNDVFARIVENNAPLVIGALAHFVKHGKAQSGHTPLKDLWASVDTEPLAGAAWPLALELTHLDVKAPASVDPSGPTALKGIFDEKCSLFEWDKSPPVFLDSDDEMELDEVPLSALGEGNGYEDDDEEDVEFENLSPSSFDEEPW